MADGGEALFLLRQAALHQLLKTAAGHVRVDPHRVPAFSAQELVDRHPVEFARDVPQRNVDGAQRPHHSGSPEMEAAVHILPVVLDAQRVLADHILPEGVDHLR